MTLKATLGLQPNAFLVPQTGVLRDAKGAYVLVVGADGKVARKDVAVDRQQGGNWVVTSGLAAGDQVVVSGVQRAQPGQPAKATPANAAGQAQPAAAKAEAGKDQAAKDQGSKD